MNENIMLNYYMLLLQPGNKAMVWYVGLHASFNYC